MKKSAILVLICVCFFAAKASAWSYGEFVSCDAINPKPKITFLTSYGQLIHDLSTPQREIERMAGDAVEISKNNQAKITAVMELAEYCTEQGAETIRVPIGGTWQYPWGSAQFRYAMHSGFLPDGKPFGQAASILLNIGGVKIYDLGDTALQQDFKLVGEIYKPDIAFVPIGGRANMNINEALVAVRWLGAGIVVPIHYDLYTEGSVDPFEFKSKLESTTNIQCMVMRP